MSEARHSDAVAELAGMHGAFSFPEHLLQRIWQRGEFDQRGLHLRDGRGLTLRFRGRWNRLGGPDFADAELVFGEGETREVVRGAVEVHLRAVDWDRHGHAQDAAYAGVVLHVVLFPSMREWTEGVGGRRIPILELLPRLERDLEAYAEDVAIEGIAGRPYSQLREALCAVAPEKLKDAVQIHAARRWQAKVRLAEARIARVGWAEACHQTALEVLGYRPNRAPMLAVAEAWAWERWRAGEVDVDTVFAAQGEAWRTQGVRPLNQPKVRLAQYARWVASKPDWPEALQAWGAAWRSEGTAPQGLERPTRKALRLAKARKALAAEVCGGALGGSRLDTWVCDAALPLLAARVGAEGTQIYEQWWRAWFPGDAPAELLQLAREFYGANAGGDGLSQGDLQGLLGWLAALSQADGRGA